MRRDQARVVSHQEEPRSESVGLDRSMLNEAQRPKLNEAQRPKIALSRAITRWRMS